MERRNFLKLLPLAAVSPRVVKDGVAAFDLGGPGHFVIVANLQQVDINELSEYPPEVLPRGSTGGWIIGVHGDPETALKFYKLDDKSKQL